MSTPSVGLLDTSVFIARETAGRSRSCRIQRTVKLTDALLAATAIEHGLPVISQDADFDAMARAHPPLIVARV